MGTSETGEKVGHPLGLHRVLDSSPRLPQEAEKLDNSLPIYSNEVLIEVERLNIDAASFLQMEEETKRDPQRIAQIIEQNCRTRGKQQNRVTGSGGMLIGTVKEIGGEYRGEIKLKRGDRVATLVSLTLTPLHIDEIRKVHLATHQVEMKGHAILFEKTIAAKLPLDIPETVAMAAFDVAGAPATIYQWCRVGQTLVLIGGGGKAGILCAAAARKKMGSRGKIFAIEPSKRAAESLRSLKVCNEVLEIDATNPVAVQSGIAEVTRGKMGDIVVNVASVPNTEMGALLAAKSKAKVLFFSMATSFPRVALGAEGIVSDAVLYFGNGYFPNHARFTIDLIRKNSRLRELFIQRYQ